MGFAWVLVCGFSGTSANRALDLACYLLSSGLVIAMMGFQVRFLPLCSLAPWRVAWTRYGSPSGLGMDTTARVFEGPSCDGLKTWKSSSSSSRFGVFRLPHAKGGSWCGIGAAATGIFGFSTLVLYWQWHGACPPFPCACSNDSSSLAHITIPPTAIPIPRCAGRQAPDDPPNQGTRWQYESRRPSLPCRSIHLRMLSGEREIGRAHV